MNSKDRLPQSSSSRPEAEFISNFHQNELQRNSSSKNIRMRNLQQIGMNVNIFIQESNDGSQPMLSNQKSNGTKALKRGMSSLKWQP